jgi:hypothetical protein
MKRHLDWLRRGLKRNREPIEQATACFLGLMIGVTLGALSLGNAPQQHRGGVTHISASHAAAR